MNQVCVYVYEYGSKGLPVVRNYGGNDTISRYFHRVLVMYKSHLTRGRENLSHLR